MSFVICEGIDRKTYVRWLRHSREIVDHCARLAGGEIGCLADSRNELAKNGSPLRASNGMKKRP